METVACDLCGSPESELLLEKDGGRYARCPHCGFIFTNPRRLRFEADNEAAFLEGLARYAEKNYSPKKQREYRRSLRPLARWRKTNRFLEIGSNVGGLLAAARAEGWEVMGVEPVAECARYGRERHGLEILPCVLEVANLPGDSFDVVYSNAVFEHLASPASVLREAHRLARPGGVVFIDTVNYDSYTRRFIGPGWKLIAPADHLSLFTPGTLRRFCAQAGFRVTRVETHGVRLRPNNSPRLRGLARWGEELVKLPLSLLCRWTLKGDSISVLAQKDAGPSTAGASPARPG
ncbi:MAG TPA: class I SAM-dependent methyltransferase [Verrucomicrobiota bacterium]|nr:class I SAM-dependent methyltransferase [Verrucomicrobiota bacterium]